MSCIQKNLFQLIDKQNGKCVTVVQEGNKYVVKLKNCEKNTINYMSSLFVLVPNKYNNMDIENNDMDIEIKSLYDIKGDILNLYTGHILTKVDYDYLKSKSKNIRQFNISSEFSLIKHSEQEIRQIIDKYKITDNELYNIQQNLLSDTSTYAYRIRSKKAIVILGNSGSGKSTIFKNSRIQQILLHNGIIKPVEIDYDSIVEHTELIKHLINICETSAFKIVYDLLYNESSKLPNIAEKMIKSCYTKGLPIILQTNEFSVERMNELQRKGYVVIILICTTSDTNLQSRRYERAKIGYIKNLNIITLDEYKNQITKYMSSSNNPIHSVDHLDLDSGLIVNVTKGPANFHRLIFSDITYQLGAVSDEFNIYAKDILSAKLSPIYSNYYRFNNSMIQYTDNMFLCAYRAVIGTKKVEDKLYSYNYSTGKYPEMWALYNSQILGPRKGLLAVVDGALTTIDNGSWQSKTFVVVYMLKYENETFYLVPGSEKFLNIVYDDYPGIEDPRLYRKADGKIYLYYMGYELTNPDNNTTLRDTISKEPNVCPNNDDCFFVAETSIDIRDNALGQTEYIINTVKYDPRDKNAPKLFCLQSQLDHKIVNKNRTGYKVFDKNYAPFVKDGHDYFGYTITKRYEIYKRFQDSTNNTEDCKQIADVPMLKIFDNLFNININVKNMNNQVINNQSTHVLHSISQNTPAIEYNDKEYIAVGHIRISNLVDRIVNGNKIIEWIGSSSDYFTDIISQNSSLAWFLKQQYEEYKKTKCFAHPNTYFMFLYTFSRKDPTKILRISNCFIPNYPNRKYTLCFAMSIGFIDRNNLFITFGEGDVYCRNLTIPKNAIDLMLKDVTTLHVKDYIFGLMDVQILTPDHVPDIKYTLEDYLQQTIQLSLTIQ